MIRKENIKAAAGKAMNTLALAGAAVTVGLANMQTVSCELGVFNDSVTVTDIPETDAIVGNVVTVIGGVARIAGLFMVAGGVIKYLQAKHEENASGESKAATAIGIGIAFTLMPTILRTIFGGT